MKSRLGNRQHIQSKGVTWLLLPVVLLLSQVVSAATPTPEQLQQLNQLTPEQQQMLLEALTQQSPQTAPLQPPLVPGEPQPFPGQLITPPLPIFEEEEEPRFEGGSTLIVQLEVPEDLDKTEAELGLLTGKINRISERNPYVLDRFGTLYLPGIRDIGLAGLSVEEATARIEAEPGLRDLVVTVTILPLTPTGTKALEPFGYDLFEGVPSTFAPATDIPVPADYVIGPGDTVQVQLFGAENVEYSLMVTRDGVINFPEIGPISVSGLTFEQMREQLMTRISEQMIGVRSNITMGPLRSIRVFVLGDAVRPGSYTVSGLSTMTNALLFSGGVRPIGSLRRIQLKRDGKVITTLDLYDLLLRGDTSGDRRLRPGDVIFVPPVGPRAGVEGEVNRPAIYELNGEKNAADIVELAGGLLSRAYPQDAQLERIESNGQRTVIDVDLSTAPGRGMRVQGGDVLRVYSILDQVEDVVVLRGHVFRPGPHQWSPGMHLTDLIESPSDVRPLTDLNYVLIQRELRPDRHITVLSADLRAAWRAPGTPADVVLEPRDQVLVFGVENRNRLIEPVVERMRLQATQGKPAQIISIGGRVRAAGDYPLEESMRVSDLIRAGGGLDQSAFTLEAELTRNTVVNNEFRATQLINIDLAAILAGSEEADIVLQSFDFLNIKEIPLWGAQQSIEIVGEVTFPGIYPIQRGELLGSALQRAGGLTDLAFPEGAVFVREELKRREREQLEELAVRLESDLTALALSEGGSPQALNVGQSLLTQLRSTEPVGRLVIDIERIIANAGNPQMDIVLRDGDKLLVPMQAQEVTVIGEVQYSTSHIYEPQLRLQEYLDLSGGLTFKADESRIYVVRASGAVVVEQRSRWFSRGGLEMRPGDTIVVPLEADRIRPLTLWTSVTTIIYNLAIAVAAVNSF